VIAAGKPEAALFDMDGTLCDVSSIRHHVMGKSKNFDAFHAAAIDCPPVALTLEHYHRQVELGREIVIVTARKKKWQYQTIWWTLLNDIEYAGMWMRENHDGRPDYEVKAGLLARIRTVFTPVIAFDDNPKVIRLWEENGIETIAIPGWDHDYDAQKR
jgi:phosphoglycolate phosphatase-like HAD superfamily hydrolase